MLASRFRLPRGDRVGVSLHHLLGDAVPRESLDGHGCLDSQGAPAVRLVVQVAQRFGQRLRVGRRHQHAIDAVGDDIPIAGDVGGHHGGAGGERFGQNHAEALAAERWRAQHVGGAQLRMLALVVDLAERAYAAGVDQHRRELLVGRPDHGQFGVDVLAQRLERAQQQRQALALDRLPDEGDPQAIVVAPIRRQIMDVGGHVDAVGDHPIATAEPALAGPGGGLRDGDSDVQVVEHLARPERVGERIREPLVGVGMKRPDQGQSRLQRCHPTHQRRDRLVDVRHVVAAGFELAAEPRGPDRRDRQVRDRSVGLQPEGAAERE